MCIHHPRPRWVALPTLIAPTVHPLPVQFKPGPVARPTLGSTNVLEKVEEDSVEV